MEGENFDMKHFNQPPIFVSVEVPYEVLEDSGIDLDGALQFYADGKKIVIEQLDDEEADFSCEGDCENCPLLFHCSKECNKCPCTAYCDRCSSEAAESSLTDFLDRLSRKEQHDALIHLTLRWAERQKKEKLEDKE